MTLAQPLIGQALPSKIIRTDGVSDLFHIAARELGDALQAWRIAEMNGLSDYWPPAHLELKIPQAQASSNDGLPIA